MKIKTALVVVLVLGSLSTYNLVRAEEEHREGGENTSDVGRNYDVHRGNPAPRPAPPRFQAHPPGVHPHGPMVRPHALRVLQPRVIKFGGHDWQHWGHPEFARPAYYWDWGVIHNVTCIAEDSYGDQYPVTEATFHGFGLTNMTMVEDDSLDRCYAESGRDPSCYLVTCSHF